MGHPAPGAGPDRPFGGSSSLSSQRSVTPAAEPSLARLRLEWRKNVLRVRCAAVLPIVEGRLGSERLFAHGAGGC